MTQTHSRPLLGSRVGPGLLGRSLIRCCLAASLLAGASEAQGRIVVFDDEWAFTDFGIANNPEGADMAVNVANWFSYGQRGSFLAYSHHIGLASASLASAMTSAGHDWQVETITSPLTIDLPTLQTYDGIFLGGVPVDNDVLTQYVMGGGNVYLMAGTAWAPSAAAEANYWNSFLGNFGLQYASTYNGIGNFPIALSGSHPILQGITGLYHSSGQSLIDLDPSDDMQIMGFAEGQPILACYSPVPLPVTYCTGVVNSAGCLSYMGTSGLPSASDTNPFYIEGNDILNSTPGFFFFGTAGRASIPALGATICSEPPLFRTATIFSGGNRGGVADCSGFYQLEFNQIIQDNPGLLPAGTQINGQYYYRDAGVSSGVVLTNGVEFTIDL